MTNEEFIEQCNAAGEAKKNKSPRYDDMAKNCGVKGFTEKGLSFLASLLSDSCTAAGEPSDDGVCVDKSKEWSMPFLSRFNPEGYTCTESSQLKQFAQQISKGNEKYDSSVYEVEPRNSKAAKMPNEDIIEAIVRKLHQNNEELTLELICEEVEDYYDEKDMLLPDKWEEVTQRNIKKWFSGEFNIV